MRNIIFVLLSFVCMLFAPEQFNVTFCSVCAAIFLLQSAFVIVDDVRDNGLLTYNTLFLSVSFISLFIYPLFIYSGLTSGSHMFIFAIFKDSAVNKVTALSTFAYSIYMMSYSYVIKRSEMTGRCFSFSTQSLNALNILSVASTIAFTINMVYYIYTHSDSINLDSNTYIFEITKTVLTVTLIVRSYASSEDIASLKDFIKINKISLCCLIIVAAEFLYIGDRGFVIVSGLTVLVSFNHFVRRIKAKYLVPMLLLAAIVMIAVAQTRSTEHSIRKSGITSIIDGSMDTIRSIKTSEEFDLLSDLTIASTASYIGYDKRKDYGLYKPARFFVILSYPVPYLPTLVSRLLFSGSNESISSDSAITLSIKERSVSADVAGAIGTQDVVDIYMSWGILGVIFCFAFFGYLLAKCNMCKNDLYWLLIYVTLFGFCIYQARSPLYQSFRPAVWNILLVKFMSPSILYK